MDKLPEEILLRIFKLLVYNVEQLARVAQVSKHFYRITQDPKLWYLSFQKRYPIWGSRIQYASNSERLIDWKDFVIHLIKQQKSTKDFTFQFVNEEQQQSQVATTSNAALTQRKRKLYDDIDNDDIDMVIDKYSQQYNDNNRRGVFVNDSDDDDNTVEDASSDEDEDDNEQQIPFWIQDPLVVDIDRITKKGVVATGKHRKNGAANRSEHKILFWEYPSWKLIRSFEMNLTPPNLTCQIIGIQSVLMPTVDGKSTQKVRFFSLAVGMALVHEFEPDIEDRVDIWKSIFVYRLFNDGSTQCVSHIKVSDIFLGREIFLFSDTSWSRSSDECGDHDSSKEEDQSQGNSNTELIDWLNIVSPADAFYDNRFTVFMLAIGPIYDRITGCVQLAKFDIRGQHNILDPSITPVYWDHSTRQITPLPKDYFNNASLSSSSLLNRNYTIIFGNPTEVIATIKLGCDVSCMIHFKYPPNLNHLICTGSYQDDELSVYDWRFGLKVGSLPWKTISQMDPSNNGSNDTANNATNATPTTTAANTQQEEEEDVVDDEQIMETSIDVRPWGLESTLVLPPYWSSNDNKNLDLSKRGFRLIAVGDNRSDNSRDKLEIKVWDISYLLQVKWNPLIQSIAISPNEDTMDLTHKFSWWSRRTGELERLALNMVQQQLLLEEVANQNNNINHNRATTTTTLTTSLLNDNLTTTLTSTLTNNIHNNDHQSQHNRLNHPPQQHNTNNSNNNIPINLPYSPPKGFQSMLLSHTFDKDEQEEENGELTTIPVKYTAYNVLYTSLFLLTEDGKVTVMDIETGKITGTVQNVAAHTDNKRLQVRGIDVNVIGGKEVVVTSKEGLLRGIVN